jgi:8-oxo-dGTP diphosphatase
MSKDGTVSVVAALAERGGRVFLARRAGHKGSPGLWELPGGKLEDGEAPDAALARELREELGIEARVEAEAYDRSELRVDSRDFRFLVFRASWDREPAASTDHDTWGYFGPRDIPFEILAPLDGTVLRRWAVERADAGDRGELRERYS